MKRYLPLPVLAVCSLLLFSACAPGNQLVVPGGITRPPLAGPPPAGPPRSAVAVVVADFAYSPPVSKEPRVIGRDYDQVRQVVWEGDPGKTMADLVAGALAERGVQTLRVKAGDPAPADAASMITGTVRRFDVDVRRRNVLSVYIEAVVGMTLSVTGGGTPTTWDTAVSTNAVLQDVFPLPDDLRKALSSAANSAAEEGVRRLQEGGAAGIAR